ncbi:MAG TPA: hypothetical protein VLC09_08250 [Polyangiaceae bacterium]|nr:hypothetical protein [Polyangiaceae bacterium]
MNTHLLIEAVVQQTMVFIAQLATSGGVRAPLAHVADQVFLELTRELQNQGVTKKVIADMFGMALRTYHRRVQETYQSRSVVGRTVWEAVYEYVREHEPISGGQVLSRFGRDDLEVVSGVLSDLVNSGLAFRSGRGDSAIYRAASEADFALGAGEDIQSWLVWLAVYRHGPLSLAEVQARSRLGEAACVAALQELVGAGRVAVEGERYVAATFETPLGSTRGWEAAVLDHYQAMITAITRKLSGPGPGSHHLDVTGGSTWSFDVPAHHPLREEVFGTLGRLRSELEELRQRVDAHNASRVGAPEPTEVGAAEVGAADESERVVVYVGQYVK